MGFFYNKSGSSSGSSNKELEKLLKIASDSNLEVPKEKVTALERFMGMMRASETSGIAADIQSGEGLGDALKTYGSRLAKGWTGQGLTEEDLSGVEGYKEVLAKEGVSEKPWFELGPIKPSTAGVAGLALDIGLDPLTYVGSGLTKAGKGAAKTAGRESLEELASRGGKEAIESIAGKTTRNFAGETSEIAGKRIGAKLGGTSAEQAKLGQKSVANFMGQPLLPKGVNETIYKSRDAILRKFGETNAGKTVDSVSKLFNTEYIPLAIKGTAKEADKRALYLAGKVSKNLDEGVKRFGKETSDSLFKQVKDKSGKDVDEAISMMGDVMNAVERTPMGGEMVKVSDDIAPMVKEALDFRDKIHKIYTVSNLKDEILKIGCCCVRKFGTDEMIKKMNAIDKEKLEAENLQAVVLRAGKLLGAGIMTVDAVFVTENYDDKLQFKTRVRKKQSKRVLSYVLGEIKERIEYKCELEDLKPSMPFGYTKNSTMILHLINKNEFSFGEGIEYKIRIKMSNLWEYKGYGGISFHIDRKLTKIK